MQAFGKNRIIVKKEPSVMHFHGIKKRYMYIQSSPLIRTSFFKQNSSHFPSLQQKTCQIQKSTQFEGNCWKRQIRIEWGQPHREKKTEGIVCPSVELSNAVFVVV